MGGLACGVPLLKISLAAATAAAKPDWYRRGEAMKKLGMKRDDHCKHCWQMNGSLLDGMLELPLRAEARVALGFMLSQQEIE